MPMTPRNYFYDGKKITKIRWSHHQRGA